MTNSKEVKRQDACLVNEPGAGAEYMTVFDSFSPAVRKRLREATFNVCCACFEEALLWNSPAKALKAIEKQIRCDGD